MVHLIVRRWGDYCGIGKLSPHDLRRTAITRALDQGLSYRQVQMMSGHEDPKTVLRYDQNRENLDQNALNLLNYDEYDLLTEREDFQNSTAEFFQLKPRATIRTFAHSDHSLVTQRGEILVCNPSGFFDLLTRLMKLA